MGAVGAGVGKCPKLTTLAPFINAPIYQCADGSLPMETELLLFSLALIAGLVDAIAGGGGLITVPALLWVGLGPLETLATNKAQGVFGTASISGARA